MLHQQTYSIREILSHIPYTANIEREAQDLIIRDATVHYEVPPGQALLTSTGRSVAFLMSGCAESGDDDNIISFHSAGDILGDEPAIKRTCPIGVRARTSCDVLVLSSDAFRDIWLRSSILQRNLASLYQDRIKAFETYCHFQRASKLARAAVVLEMLALAIERRQQIVGWDEVRLPFAIEWWSSKRTLASLLSIAAPTLYDSLKRMAEAGAIDIGDWEEDKKVRFPIILLEDCVPILARLSENL
jgi:CRP-like cAMP-binding protein